LAVSFRRPVPARAAGELAHLPGVAKVEGVRAVPVRISAGHRFRDTVIEGLPTDPDLRRVFHAGEDLLLPPDQGLVLGGELARLLAVRAGQVVEVEILEGDFDRKWIRVAGVVEEPMGLPAYARDRFVSALIPESPRISGALLRIEPGREREVRGRLTRLPAVIGISSTRSVIDAFEEQTGESLAVITLILTLSASAIAIGVVYNNARVALSLRGRELASLRVLGFTRREISAVLLGELGAQLIIGIPLGLLLGTAWAHLYASTFDAEALRLPVYIAPSSYAIAAAIALVSGLASALLVRRRLDELDLIGVLKSAE
jgi:putative ABC transport system permease protein